MAIQLISSSSSSSVVLNILQNNSKLFPSYTASSNICFTKRFRNRFRIGCSKEPIPTLRTCRNCKTQFDPLRNHPRACLYHTAHFGGETKRKFESVHSGGTMSTPDSGKVFQYWHCCGSEDPFDLGCTSAPHSSYDE